MELRERNHAIHGVGQGLPGGSEAGFGTGTSEPLRQGQPRRRVERLASLRSLRPLVLVILGAVIVMTLWFIQMRVEGQSSVKVDNTPAKGTGLAELGVIYVGSNAQRVERQRAGLPNQEGLLVTEVKPGGPAAQAGIREGDLLVELDGKALIASDSLLAVLAGYHPGDRVQLTVVRQAERQKIEVILGQL